MKRCTRCRRTDVYFSKNKANRDGLQSWCKECSKRPMTPERQEYMRLWRAENSESRKAYDLSERGKFQRRTWRQSDGGKEVRRIIQKKRRALARHAEATLSTSEWLEIKKSYDGRCVYCNRFGAETQDHIIPLASGGKHTKENVVPACTSCNSSKRDKPLIVWMAQKVALNV